MTPHDESAPPVTSEEELTRFLFSRHHFSKSENRVLADAFLPPPKPLPWQTSTYRTSTLSLDQIWQLGEDVRGVRKQSLKARADIRASSVVVKGTLRLLPTSEGITVSPQLHVDIVGWPDSPELQRMIATELAARAALHLRSDAESA